MLQYRLFSTNTMSVQRCFGLAALGGTAWISTGFRAHHYMLLLVVLTIWGWKSQCTKSFFVFVFRDPTLGPAILLCCAGVSFRKPWKLILENWALMVPVQLSFISISLHFQSSPCHLCNFKFGLLASWEVITQVFFDSSARFCLSLFYVKFTSTDQHDSSE